MLKIFKTNLFFFVFLFLVVLVLYGKSVNFGTTNFDDDTFVLRKNKYIANLKNFPNFFLTDCYLGKQTQYYRPILSVSFAIEHFLFKANLKGFHITNILLYIFALFIIFIFLSKLKFNKNILKFLILLFAVHPVLSSVPVWIPARNDTLLTIFFLSSLINFINYIKTNKTKFLIFHFLFFFLSLFSKETTVLLIIIYPLLIYCFNLKATKKQIKNNLFFVVPLLIIYFILRHFAVRSIDIFLYFNNCLYYIKTVAFGVMLYIEKIVYPTNMQILLFNLTPTLQTCVINVFVFIIVLYFYLKRIIDRKILIFAMLFSLLAILPTFIQEEYAFFTHRLIISLPGIIIISASLIEKVTTKYPVIKLYLGVSFIFVFLLFSFCSFTNIDKYKDSLTYWSQAYKDAPDYNVVCDALAKEYNTTKQFDRAIDLSLKAINLKNSFNNYLTYAIILFDKGEYEKSKDVFLQLSENDDKNLLIFKYLSNIYLIEKNVEKAVECAKKGIECADNIDSTIEALENFAMICSVSNNFHKAIPIVLRLLTFDKNNARYYNLLSLLYEDIRNYDDAVINIEKALTLEPDNDEYQKQLKHLEEEILTKHR